MAAQPSPKMSQPVCPKHWDKMRKETLKGLPFWSRPFASGTVSKLLRKQGFVESATECAFCRTNTDVDEVK